LGQETEIAQGRKRRTAWLSADRDSGMGERQLGELVLARNRYRYLHCPVKIAHVDIPAIFGQTFWR
jgi:hypothetical protein